VQVRWLLGELSSRLVDAVLAAIDALPETPRPQGGAVAAKNN
jgi:hypothetical protein